MSSRRHKRARHDRTAANNPRPQVSPLPAVRLSTRTRIVLSAVALAALTLLVFAPVLSHPFLEFDDPIFISQNPAYNPPTASSLLRYWIELRPTTQFYVPVMQSIWWALAALTWRASAPAGTALPAGPFHAANLLAHAAAAVLAFALIRRMVKSPAAAWVGAALFALHPIQAEAVSWASTLYTPLSTAFALGALLLLSRYLVLRYDSNAGSRILSTDSDPTVAPESDSASRKRRAALALAAGTLLLLAGLLSKPAVVLTPIVAAAMEIGIRRRPWRHLVLPLLLWMAISIPVMVVAKLTQPPAEPYWAVWKRPFLAADALTFYLSKIAAPVQLAPDYGRSPDWLAASGAWRYTWVAPVLAAAGLAFASVRGRSGWPVACGVAFVAAALPTLGLAPFDYQEYSSVADRYLYFAMFAVGLGAAGLLTLPRTPRQRTLAFAAAGCVVAACAALSHRQTWLWRDSQTLFRHNLEVNPNSLLGNLIIAEAEARAGNNATAVEHFRAALEAHGDSRLALGRFGDFALRLGRYDDAITFYTRALASSRVPNAKLLGNLGAALSQAGRQDEAAAVLERSILLEPQFRDARLSLAVVRFKLQQWHAARAQFEEALRIDPNSAAARDGLAQLKAMGH